MADTISDSSHRSGLKPAAAFIIGLTARESSAIVATIRPSFVDIAGRYDVKKYSPEVYENIRAAFRAPAQVSAEALQDALLWKYGHFGKSRIPGAHQRLISHLQREWPHLVHDLPQSPEVAFEFINERFGGVTRFVVAGARNHHYLQLWRLAA